MTDPKWLYKAKKDDVPIDIIFKSAGNIYLDDETFRRATPIEFMGKGIPILPAEDLIVMKSLATEEFGPHHWFDALDVIKSGKDRLGLFKTARQTWAPPGLGSCSSMRNQSICRSPIAPSWIYCIPILNELRKQ
ncbi:MAG: nucleotidyltransferase [Candidatus Manganitrophus sp.]|nr:nucleotidyltransferase [Candidatus Manganitrophus sp.]